MTRLLIMLIVMTLGLARADVPKLFREKEFNYITLANAVNHFVDIGEDAAVKELEELSDVDAAEAARNHVFNPRGFSVNERVGWVCRILFNPKAGSKQPEYLRAPKFGKLGIPEKYIPISQWPLYPVVFSGSTFFVVGEIYTDENTTPEDARHYLEYCVENGDFRATPIKIMQPAQAAKDADALLKSAPWLAIQWSDDSGYSYPMGEQWTTAFILRQTKLLSK